MPARCARYRFVGGSGNRRVPAQRARRSRRRDCLARIAAVVQRPGGHVRLQLLGLQLVAAGLRAAGGAWCDLRDLCDRRPLHRRCALHGRRAAGHRPRRLLPLHGPHERTAARAGSVGRRLARRMAGTHRRPRTVVAHLDGGATGRAVLAAWFGAAPVRTHRVPDDDRRRMGRRISQQHISHVRTPSLREGTVDRAVEPHGPLNLPSGTAHRPRAGDDHLLRQVAA